jgi:myo-inositol-1(or 4)-monophosphatase
MREILETAVAAGAAAAAVIRSRSARPGAIRTKSNAVDMVTDTDVAAGVAIARVLTERDRSARFVVEEPEVYELSGVTEGTLGDDAVWVIDPIDGTTSFIHGYPCYGVSIAYLQAGVPVAGCVYNVPLGEVFAAATGQGATRDGEPISCSQADDLTASLLVTGFPYDRGATLGRQLRLFGAVVPHAQGIRRDGSAALDCCHVACGRADAFWELSLKPWDMAAGVVILREAGATVTDLHGAPWTPATEDILAASPGLHAPLLELLRSADTG